MALPGTMELLVIMLVALLIFGPRRMPEIGRTVARTLRQLTKIRQDLIGQITSIEDEPLDDPYTRKDDPV